MRKKRFLLLVLLLIFVSILVFNIYKNTYKEEYNYVVLGDSLAAGRNPYGIDDYGYTDYIRDYLIQENKLESYVSYAVSGYTTLDIMNDINHNKIVDVNGKNIGIKKALRESDIVTISIGANDFLKGINLSNFYNNLISTKDIKNNIDNVLKDIENLLQLIKQYAKGDIIVVGYYNPIPSFDKYKTQINDIISYVDLKYGELCADNDIYYVKISDDISINNDCLPNPSDIHLSKKGYEIISKEVIKVLKNKVFD